MDDAVYEPQEDSFLLQRWVRKKSRGTVLDMGTGSGLQARTAADKKAVSEVLALDIQPEVIAHCRKHAKDPKITYLTSDLFRSLRKDTKGRFPKSFDTIIFNPPYLPSEPKAPDKALDGGRHGYETIIQFLEEAGDFLTPDGRILLLFSSLSRKDVIDNHLELNQYSWEEVDKEHFSFEDLYVYQITKTQLRRKLENRGLIGLRYFTKGKRGVLFRGRWEGMEAVAKTKNPSSQAEDTIKKESDWLKTLNALGIGPFLLFSGKGFVVYRYVEGTLIRDWLPEAPLKDIRRILKRVLEQMAILDENKIAKEEMLRPHKHIIILGRGDPVLVDFERAHRIARPRNIPQFCQYLTSSYIVGLLKEKGHQIEVEEIRRLAKLYKNRPSRDIITTLKSLL